MSRPRMKLFDRATWVVGLGTAIGYANTSATSWQVSALLKEGRLPVDQASLVVMAELLAMALTMVALAPLSRTLPRKPAMILALAAMVALQLISANARGFWPLALCRALTGSSFGWLYAIAILNGADTADPQRTFARAAAIALGIGTLFNPLVGYGSAHAGFNGVLAGTAVYCLIFALPLMALPFRATRQEPAAERQPMPKLDLVTGAGVIGIMALLTIAANGTMLFTVEVAGHTGLSGTRLGTGLAVVSLVSASGGLVAGAVGRRFGTFAPVAVGLLLMAATLGSFTLARTQAEFWAVITLAVSLFWFLSPYIFGLATEVDPAGRLASVTGSTKIVSSAVAAGLAGWIASRSGLVAVGLCAATLCIVLVPLAWLVLRRLHPARRTSG